MQHDLQTCKYEIHSIFMTKLVTEDSSVWKCSTAILQYAKLQWLYIASNSLLGLLPRTTNCHTQTLWFCTLNLFSHLKQGREHMKCINCTRTIRVAHELVDVTTPGFFCIITCCWLKCSKDGGKKRRGRRGGILINISKTEGEKKKRWWKENTKKVADKICYNREIKSQDQLQHFPKNIHEFSNFKVDKMLNTMRKTSKSESLSSGHYHLSSSIPEHLNCFLVPSFAGRRLKFHRRIKLSLSLPRLTAV